jgi:hypothetical protein
MRVFKMCSRLKLLTLGWTLIVFSCVSGTAGKKQENAATAPPNGGVTVNVINNTWMDVEIFDETRVISRNSEKTISLPHLQSDLNDGYSVTYRVNLMDDIYLIRRSENIIAADGQSTIIVESPDFYFEQSYFIVRNGSKQTISLRKDRRNSETIEYILPVLRFDQYTSIPNYGATPYIKPDNQQLYDTLVPGDNLFLIETDQYKTIPFSIDRISPGCIYFFIFDGKSAVLTDKRPLRRIGEPPWSRTLTDISSPAILTAEGAGAFVVSSADYELRAANRTAEGGLLSAGFAEQNDNYIPITRKEAEDGTLRWQLEPSRRADSRSVYYLALTRGDGDHWFTAGGADTGINEAAGFKAYIRCFRDLGVSAAVQWELGPDDFTERCGAVKSLSWDAARRRCLVTGDFLNTEGMIAYIAFIDSNGKILKVDAGFRGFSFSKIISATDGAYYLIGEEQKQDGLSYAVLLKYSAEGERLWRTLQQPPAESYYQDAVLDEDEGTIVLAGTMNGTDSHGSDGNPFIECVNTTDGKQEWIKVLDEPVFKGLTLAAGIIKAPDYGYVLSLAGITGGVYRTPFIVARVNTRGFYNIP